MSEEIRIEKVSTDVLVIGGGIAGTLAAATAAGKGMDVILLERANTLRSGNAGSGIDHLTSFVPPVHDKVGYTKEMMKDELAGGFVGRGLGNREIGDHFVDVSFERIMGLEKYGVKLRFEDAHLPGGFRLVPQFQNVPTSINFEGRDLKVKLTKAALDAGVKIINHALAVSILTDDEGRARGAVAVSSREKKIIEVTASAVILSVAKGAGRLSYPCNKEDRHYENPSACGSGSAISLALSAGAEVANLEFCLSEGELSFMGFSTRVGSPGSSWWPAARAVDDDGEVVVKRIYDLDSDDPDYVEKHTKMWKEFMDEFYSMHGFIKNGRQLYMDLEEASDKEIEYIRWTLGHEGRCWLWLQNLKRAGKELKDVKLPYKYEHKVSMRGPCSGVFVNSRCETTVRGLYAAGDTMGLGAGSGPFAVVYGIEAGIRAAELVGEQAGEEKPRPRTEETQRILSLAKGFYENEGGEPWQNIEAAARGIVNTFGSAPLTDTKIGYALKKLKELKGNINIHAQDPHEAARAFEALSLIDSAEAIFRAAEYRKESFGSYKRASSYREWEESKDRKDPEKTLAYTISRDETGGYLHREYDFTGELDHD